jgi:hypothetical protein
MSRPAIGVTFAGAARSNQTAIDTLLAALPNEIASALRSALTEMAGKGFQGMRYDPGTATGFFIACNPTVLTCWTLGGVSLHQSEEIFLTLGANKTLDDETVVGAYRQVTGYEVQEVIRH